MKCSVLVIFRDRVVLSGLCPFRDIILPICLYSCYVSYQLYRVHSPLLVTHKSNIRNSFKHKYMGRIIQMEYFIGHFL